MCVCVCVSVVSRCAHTAKGTLATANKAEMLGQRVKCAVTSGSHVATKLGLFRPTFVLSNEKILQMVTKTDTFPRKCP